VATTPTGDEIAEAMERERVAACLPGGRSYTGFPNGPQNTAESLTADGWCCVGWVCDMDGGRDYGVWYNPETGAGRLKRRRRGVRAAAALSAE
jgi:hypothetical protein